MKKLFFFSAVVLLMSITAKSQSITFGVKGGANFSNLKVDTDAGGGSPDGATSLYVGGLVDLGISEKFHIQPELLYSIEGADDLDISFINLPIMGKYYVTESLNVQFGPQIGFVVDAEGGTDDIKATNISLNFGAAYELPSGLFFDARYNLGVSDINDSDVEDFGVGDVELRTKGFQIGLGYRFL